MSCSEPESRGCPTPRVDRALEVVDENGELRIVPLGCGRNGCPFCRRRNVQLTAAKLGLNAEASDRPPSHAVLSTTRLWVDDSTLRQGWAQFAAKVRKKVNPNAGYFWCREWTEGRNDGVRRTHYHSGWTLDNDDQAQAVAEISNEVWGRLAGAWSEKAHGWQRIYDSGGLMRYVAGLVGHHLKENQAPPPGWSGRRFGTSKGFYAVPVAELDRQAREVVRDQRLVRHLERAMADDDSIPDRLPAEIWDELLTDRLRAARSRPKPRVVVLDRHGVQR